MLHNNDGNFNHAQVMECHDLNTLYTWQQHCLFDIVRLKNNIARSKNSYRDTSEPDPDYIKRIQAYNIQVGLNKIIECQIAKVKNSFH